MTARSRAAPPGQRLLMAYALTAAVVLAVIAAYAWSHYHGAVAARAALRQEAFDAATERARTWFLRTDLVVATLARSFDPRGDCAATSADAAALLPSDATVLGYVDAAGGLRCAGGAAPRQPRLRLADWAAQATSGGTAGPRVVAEPGAVDQALLVAHDTGGAEGVHGRLVAALGMGALRDALGATAGADRLWLVDGAGRTIPLRGEPAGSAPFEGIVAGGLLLRGQGDDALAAREARAAMLRVAALLLVLAAGSVALAVVWHHAVGMPVERLRQALAQGDEEPLRAMAAMPDAPLRSVALAATAGQARMRRRLALRDLLLREMSHRWRNNLSMISSLLRLEARRVADGTARAALEAAEERVRTLALLQHDLQDAASGPPPMLGDFAWRIVERHIAGSEDLANRIAVRWAGDDVPLACDQVMAVGLIVNEWAAQALRGPLVGSVEGSIHLRVLREPAGATLLWADNGQNAEPDIAPGLSGAILEGLVVQIGGELRRSEAGIRWRLFVPAAA